MGDHNVHICVSVRMCSVDTVVKGIQHSGLSGRLSVSPDVSAHRQVMINDFSENQSDAAVN